MKHPLLIAVMGMMSLASCGSPSGDRSTTLPNDWEGINCRTADQCWASVADQLPPQDDWAVHKLEIACGGDIGAACFALADTREHPQDRELLLMKACRLGHAPACQQWGLERMKLQPEGSLSDVLEPLETACSTGFALSCAAIGVASRAPWNTAVDQPHRYFLLACGLGLRAACRWAVPDMGGSPYELSPTHAEILAKACAAGNEVACHWAARVTSSNQDVAGMAASPELAAELQRKACAGGVKQSCAPSPSVEWATPPFEEACGDRATECQATFPKIAEDGRYLLEMLEGDERNDVSAATNALSQSCPDFPTCRPAQIRGSLLKSEIRGPIKAARPLIKGCYDDMLRRAGKPHPKGRVLLRFTIGSTGDVVATTVTETGLEEPEFLTCLQGVVKGLKFPEPTGGGIVIVNYPFNFST